MTDSSNTRSPRMAQYVIIREELQREILLAFRIGDFYHFFDCDAVQVEALLTDDADKEGRDETQPAHSIAILASDSEQMFRGFLSCGYAVAICEEIEPDEKLESTSDIRPYEVIDIKRPSICDFINPERPPNIISS